MVSIIVPVYNCIKTIYKCVESIREQSFRDWELLLIDDGSSDGSGNVCDQFAAADSRIRVVHRKNGGVSAARNAGIDLAAGEYVMFCDGDDFVTADWCQELVHAAQAFPASLPLCNYYRNAPTAVTVNREDACSVLAETLSPADLYRLYQLELIGTPWNKLFRRDILDENHVRFRLDLSLGEDLLFNLDYLKHQTGGFVFIRQPLYHYSLGNSDSLSTKYYPDLLNIYHILFSELKEALCRIPGAYEASSADYYRSWFFAFDRVFRNTWSDKNPLPKAKKWQYNAAVYSSAEFQECKKAIPKGFINAVQYYALQTNSFYLYWSTVAVTEAISRRLHR